jgi:hypothetical protein
MQNKTDSFEKVFERALIRNGETLESFEEFRKYKDLGLAALGIPIPEETDRCICNAKIKINCYAAHPQRKKALVLGSCCIHRTMTEEQRLRHCEKCDKSHKNRKNNLCDACAKDAKAKAKRQERDRKAREAVERIQQAELVSKMARKRLRFGKKYNGVLISEICANDDNYVDWVFQNLDHVKFKDTLDAFRFYTGRD